MKNHYLILEVSPLSSDEEIKKAYRNMAMKYHPDRNNDPAAARRMKEVNSSHRVLSSPEKRKAYDIALKENHPHLFSKTFYKRKKVICEGCQGNGSLIFMECKACTGTGNTSNSNTYDLSNVKDFNCSLCHGRGKLISGICRACLGEGHIFILTNN